jgi:transposase-like protein
LARKRRNHSNQFKFKVALEATQGLKTLNEIASQYNLHPNQVSTWKKQLLTEGPTVFSNDTARQLQAVEEREADLYEQIGRLKMELEWLKKKAALFD